MKDLTKSQMQERVEKTMKEWEKIVNIKSMPVLWLDELLVKFSSMNSDEWRAFDKEYEEALPGLNEPQGTLTLEQIKLIAIAVVNGYFPPLVELAKQQKARSERAKAGWRKRKGTTQPNG